MQVTQVLDESTAAPDESAAPRPAAARACCSNCDEPLHGEFCSRCGQRDRELDRPFGQLASEGFEHALSLDSKVVRTIAPLLFAPGRITRSYLGGRRVAYVPPLRTYLVAALIFFGLFSVFPVRQMNVAVVTRGSAEERAATGRTGNYTTFSVPARAPFGDQAYQQAVARARQNPQAFARAAYASVPRLFFLFLPLFALLLELFYRTQGYYFEHLVFSLYSTRSSSSASPRCSWSGAATPGCPRSFRCR